MKTIDIKSMIIGVLLTTTVLFGMGATGKADAGKWDDKQEWLYATFGELGTLGLIEDVELTGPSGFKEDVKKVTGWEPWAQGGSRAFRKRIK